jgi:phospholipid/cholesterol/gamma-HCH transport system substrate-binding protein
VRRRFIVVAAIAAAAVLAGQNLSVQAADRGRVDVVFDTAKGLVAGQAVKVAGVQVGTIDAVSLERAGTAGYRARLTLSIDREFLPFHADASCQILPQGLLSEQFVACDAGSPSSPPLGEGSRATPTVPVDRTSVPASLQDVLNTFDVPTSERLTVLLNGLGAGTAGRGADIRSILRRAFPALDETDRALALVNDQRTSLRRAVRQSDRILADLAVRDDDVRAFVDRVATVTETTAARREELALAVRRAPALLDELDTTLPAVRRIARSSAPLLTDLRRAAPRLSAVTDVFGRFTDPAPAALTSLGTAAEQGRAALGPGRPTIAAFRRLVEQLRPVAPVADRLLLDLRDRGGAEGVFGFFYTLGAAVGIYDGRSHLLPIIANVNPRCIVASIAPGTQVEPGCSHAYASPGLGKTPQTLAPPTGSSGRSSRLSRKSLTSLLDYLLR